MLSKKLYQKQKPLILLLIASCAGFIFTTLSLTGHNRKNIEYEEVTAKNSSTKDGKRSNKPEPVITRKQDTELDTSNQSELSNLNHPGTAADDPHLVKLIRDYFIIPPSNQPYQLDSPDCLDQSRGQAPFVDSRLRYKKNGFFIESGAYDGESMSNTLLLERKRHWRGVLIEPNPMAFERLRKKHRKAYAINACLSSESYPSKKMLTDNLLESKVFREHSLNGQRKKQNFFSIQCFPLYSILLALNETTVDYMSLDVEGAEHGVLETIPWHKVHIQMVSVEYDKWPSGARSLCKYMSYKGYECLLTMSGNSVSDAIFMKKTTHRKSHKRHSGTHC